MWRSLIIDVGIPQELVHSNGAAVVPHNPLQFLAGKDAAEKIVGSNGVPPLRPYWPEDSPDPRVHDVGIFLGKLWHSDPAVRSTAQETVADLESLAGRFSRWSRPHPLSTYRSMRERSSPLSNVEMVKFNA